MSCCCNRTKPCFSETSLTLARKQQPSNLLEIVRKTTLARVVFHMVSREFDGCCFLHNVREVCEKEGLLPLQQQIIRSEERRVGKECW